MLSLASNISATQALDFQYSIDFDGTNDYIDTGQNFSSVFNDSFSISLWVRPDDGQPSASEYFFGVNDNDEDIVRAELLTNGKVKFVIEGNDDTLSTETPNEVFINGGQSSVGFTHLLFVVTKSSGSDNTTVDIYVNGVDTNNTFDTLPEADHALFSSSENLVIGARNKDGTIRDYFSGKIDEFAIFNTALGSTEPLAIYNNRSPLNLKINQGNYNSSSALQVYYRMGNGLLDDINNSMSTSNEQGIIVDQSGTVTIDADQSVAINTTNWETVQTGSTPANLNGQTPVGNGVITFDGTQTGFCGVRPKSAYWNKTVVGEFYRVEVHYTRSAGTVQLKSSGDEGTNSGISLSAGSDVSVQQIGIGYIKSNNANWQLTFSPGFVGTVTKVVLQKITPNTSAIVKNGATRSDNTP